MAILVSDNSYRRDKVFALLKEQMPQADLRLYPDTGRAEDITYAIMFRPAPGSLQNLPNLKAIFMTSAGVDSVIRDETLPDVPIIRNTDTHLADGIREYVVYQVLHYHRFFHRYAAQQPQKNWKQYPQIPASDRVVGFLGMGEMARPAAAALKALGFTLRSWTRTPKQQDGVTSFHGPEQLHEFLSGAQILINLLPLTDSTRGILNNALFSQLPKGAVLINIGRGDHLNEGDLIAALDSGQLSAATLDVFPVEPLSDDSPLWTHPGITITPHIASLTSYPNVCARILATIAEIENGAPVPTGVDRQRQY